jgi:AraC family transcriptional regulator of adaptative response/methylated-DNA-[protein]-cysteine methyltransferase
VLFFAAPSDAERAGYRPCRRCRPRERADTVVQVVRRAAERIAAHGAGRLPLAELAAEAGMSERQFQRAFARITGVTPRQYREACRLERVKSRLKSGASITMAMYDTGYSSTSRLYERAPAQLGMTPATYQRGADGVRVAYTIADSPLGRLLVAGTERGVCAVSLADTDEALEARLEREYPGAERVRDDATLAAWVEAIVRHLRGEEPHLDLPLDVRATAFQWRVWEALRAIPYGRTRSYGEVARALGRPTAARAVARACASNPVPLLIPCHRVGREGGQLGGYGLGLERKRKLLEMERRIADR